MRNHKIPVITQIVYDKNEKVYTCFCYKILLFSVINKDLKIQISEYQIIRFLRVRVWACYFSVIALVTSLLFSVIAQISFYIKNKKRDINKLLIRVTQKMVFSVKKTFRQLVNSGKLFGS